ncbi:MAG: hypothetical protein EXR98_13295 [Gemmataceae bacterium]|nr:hypothetical protein [Gemmataceae bacterium]
MKIPRLISAAIALSLFLGVLAARKETEIFSDTFQSSKIAKETEIFSDTFQSPKISSAWTVHEGNWAIENGALTVNNGGLIVLNTPPGGRFTMEFEIAFPSNWMSVIPFFTGPEDYGTLYFGGGYWESFEMEGKNIGNYVQRRDPEIIRTGGFQKIKVISDYGLVSFSYDGKEKGPATIPFRPGSRVAFRSLPKSGPLRIKTFRLATLGSAGASTVYQLPVSALVKGVIYKDYQYEGKPSPADLLTIEASTGVAELKYGFKPGEVFESCFVRIPVGAAKSKTILMDVESDNSRNTFFIIVHDVSGEQHLVFKTGMAWKGWQNVGVNLQTFLESPPKLERSIIHWGGDQNQKIDFPIKAIDIGVAKHHIRVKDSGQVRFRNVRFTE